MNQKIGRNDPCPCGSGKKYKSCCFLKEKPKGAARKLTAKWINAPAGPNLIDRAFGGHMAPTGETFKPLPKPEASEENESPTKE